MRFAFLALRPNYDVLRRYHQARQTGFDVEPLIALLGRLNRAIADPNYAVGISYFLHTNLGAALKTIWTTEIEPYLEEYFFDQPTVVEEYRWGQIRTRFGGSS